MMLHERLGFDPNIIEAQLAHSVRESLGWAYNRTEFVEQRRAMLQTCADFLGKLRRGAEVAPLRKVKQAISHCSWCGAAWSTCS